MHCFVVILLCMNLFAFGFLKPNGRIIQKCYSVTPDGEWDSSLIPNNYKGVQDLMVDSMREALFTIERQTGQKRFAVDLLTPGLNPLVSYE